MYGVWTPEINVLPRHSLSFLPLQAAGPGTKATRHRVSARRSPPADPLYFDLLLALYGFFPKSVAALAASGQLTLTNLLME